MSFIILPGVFNLILRAEFAGVSDGSFRFNVKILDSTSNKCIFRIDSYLFPHYEDNKTVTVNINISGGGVFTFVVLAVNSFGSSVGYVTVSEITVTRGTCTYIVLHKIN